MELLRHAEFDVSRRVILMVSSVTDIANLVQSQDTMRDYFIVTRSTTADWALCILAAETGVWRGACLDPPHLHHSRRHRQARRCRCRMRHT